jgi:hypothetical protein
MLEMKTLLLGAKTICPKPHYHRLSFHVLSRSWKFRQGCCPSSVQPQELAQNFAECAKVICELPLVHFVGGHSHQHSFHWLPPFRKIGWKTQELLRETTTKQSVQMSLKPSCPQPLPEAVRPVFCTAAFLTHQVDLPGGEPSGGGAVTWSLHSRNFIIG